MATAENLKDAFAGESQANRKYLAFAKKAEQDGFKQVARLFRAAAGAETMLISPICGFRTPFNAAAWMRSGAWAGSLRKASSRCS